MAKNPAQPNRKEKAIQDAIQRGKLELYPQWLLPTRLPKGTTVYTHYMWASVDEEDTKKEIRCLKIPKKS